MKTRLALFDLDGTLYDTRRVNFLSYQKALEQFGYTMDYEYFANQCHNAGKQCDRAASCKIRKKLSEMAGKLAAGHTGNMNSNENYRRR